MMKVVWHGHYAKYFEVARCHLLDKIDYNYQQMEMSGYAWPVIDMQIRYAHPLRFGQWVKVSAKLVEYEHRLKINYEVSDLGSGKRLTKGYTVQVAVAIDGSELQFESPKVLLEKLGINV